MAVILNALRAFTPGAGWPPPSMPPTVCGHSNRTTKSSNPPDRLREIADALDDAKGADAVTDRQSKPHRREAARQTRTQG